jgi:hypothetical protein
MLPRSHPLANRVRSRGNPTIRVNPFLPVKRSQSPRVLRETEERSRREAEAREGGGADLFAIQPSPPPVHFASDPNAIVTVNVSTVIAPTPNTYQQCGALLSFGGTELAAQQCYELTQFLDLSDIIVPAGTVTSAAWATGVVTITTTVPLPTNWTVGSTPHVVISGFVPALFNGSFAAQVTGPNTFTYPLATTPGTATTMGTYQPNASVELSQMATTFFSQGNMISVYVLEMGLNASDAADVTALENWLSLNPRSFYGYLFPRRFGSVTATLTALENLLKQYQAPESMTYFWLTVTQTTMNLLQPQPTIDAPYKDVIQFIEAPILTDPTKVNLTDPEGEFSAAAMFYNAINYSPSQINMIAPMAFKYLYGVTMFPTQGNGPLLKSIKANNTNYVATGAQGGIAYNIVYPGWTMDAQDYFNWWYTIDWVQIAAQQSVTNAVVNGANNPIAPLYYNQDGINTLAATLAGTMYQAATYGMVLGTITVTSLNQPGLQQAITGNAFAGMCDVNAVPFLDYTLANPGDYKIGEYDGLSVLFIPQRGFIHILVTIVASDLISVG